MIPTPITDHRLQAIARLTDPSFRGKVRFEALLASYINRIQELEDATWEVINERLLENSVGVQLDIWGLLLTLPRTSDDDDAYRLALQARILIIRSKGTHDELIAILLLLLGVESGFRIKTIGSRQIRIWLDIVTDKDPNLLARLLNQARAAGKQLRLLYSPSPFADRFTLRYSADPNDPAKGLSQTLGTARGLLMSVIS